MEVYDVENNKWSAGPLMGSPRGRFDIAVLDGVVRNLCFVNKMFCVFGILMIGVSV